MYVDMGNGLTGSSVYVDADVKPVRLIFSGCILFGVPQETHEILYLMRI